MRFLRISSAQGLNHSSIVFGKQKLIIICPVLIPGKNIA